VCVVVCVSASATAIHTADVPSRGAVCGRGVRRHRSAGVLVMRESGAHVARVQRDVGGELPAVVRADAATREYRGGRGHVARMLGVECFLFLFGLWFVVGWLVVGGWFVGGFFFFSAPLGKDAETQPHKSVRQ
jgi:hypothetical protein